MQHDRAQNILSGQTALAKRVFEAVPMQAFWSVQEISTEMTRLGGHNLSKGEITGCLRCLVDAGLINETASLTFRSNVKPPKPVLKEVAPVTAPAMKAAKPKLTLMEQLFDVATSLRTAAEQIDALALEVDSTIVEAGKGDERFRQMQATLRGLMQAEV